MIKSVSVEFELSNDEYLKIPCPFSHAEGLSRYFEMDKYLKDNPDIRDKAEPPTLVSVNNQWFGVVALPKR